jgi:hypothetical protein
MQREKAGDPRLFFVRTPISYMLRIRWQISRIK